MGKFSKIFHHIESKDLRNKYEQKKAAKIQEEKKKEDTKKYVTSAMEQVKYNWRSKFDVGEAIREGMTTTDTFGTTTAAAPGDGDVTTPDAIDATSYANTNNMFGGGATNNALDGTQIRASGSGSGSGGFDVGGDYLAFQGSGSGGSRMALLSPIDSSEIDTLSITAIRGTGSNGGEEPDIVGQEELYLIYKTPDMSRSSYISQDRNQTNVGAFPGDAAIIAINQGDGTLQNYSIKIPEYARAKGTIFGLFQLGHSGSSYDHYGVTEIKFQRKAPISVFVPLDNPEASSFIRAAPPQSTPKKRKKGVDEKLEASDEYTLAQLGDEFPGAGVRVGGEDPFKGAKIGDDVEPSPQGKDEVKKSFGDFNNQTTTVSGAPTAQPEAEPEPTTPSAQTTMEPKTEDGEPIDVKTVGGKNSGVVQGADAATLDAQEPETTEPETTEPEIPEPEPLKPEPPDETKTPEEVEKIENEKFNAKADETADYIDKLIDFDLNLGLSSFNAFAQVTGVAINAVISVVSFASLLRGATTVSTGDGFLGGLGKIKNSIDIARGVLSGKVVNTKVLPQEYNTFIKSLKVDEFSTKQTDNRSLNKINISDVRHEYADDNIYVKDGKIYQNGSGKQGEGGIYATPLAGDGFAGLGNHGFGYAQMIIPKDGSEPYLHYYDHNYENLNNASDVSFTGGILQTSKAETPQTGAGPLLKSISNIIHQLKGDNIKFIPQKLRQSLMSYFGAFDQVYEGLLKTSSLEGFPPGIHGSALTDFKVPLSKLPQETQDMIAGHPLSWTPERIENMTPEQINEQLYPLLETEEQFQNYLDFTTDITKMSVEPVNTVPFAVAMEEMDEVYEQYENDTLEKYGEDGWEEFTSGLNRDTSEFFAAEKAAVEDIETLKVEEEKELDENDSIRGTQVQLDLWDKLVKPAYDAFDKAAKSGGVSGNSPIAKRLERQHAKWKKQTDKMEKDFFRIQSEIMGKYRDQREPIENIANAQLRTLREPVKDSPYGQPRWKTVNYDGNESSGADYTALDGTVYKGQNTYYDEYYNGEEQFYNQMDALYEPVADLQKYVDGAFVREGITEKFENDFGFSGDNWSPAKSGDGKPRGGSGKPKPKPDPRSSYAGTGADAATFAFDGGTSVAGNYPNASDQQILRNQLNAIKDPAKAKREQQRLLKMYGIYFPLASEGGGGDVQVAHYQPKGDNILEKYARPQPRRGLFEKVKSKDFFNPNDIKPIFPENPPPKLDPKTGMHPQYGKKAGRYKKLDPISANSMPPTGDPEIDAVVNKQKTINKIKKMAKKNLKESDFTNITKGNKVGQTFQHTSGATITLDATMGDTSMKPSQVTLDLGFGEKITVDAPGENEFGFTGVTKPLDMQVKRLRRKQSEDEINDRLDASQKFAQKVGSEAMMDARVDSEKSDDELVALQKSGYYKKKLGPLLGNMTDARELRMNEKLIQENERENEIYKKNEVTRAKHQKVIDNKIKPLLDQINSGSDKKIDLKTLYQRGSVVNKDGTRGLMIRLEGGKTVITTYRGKNISTVGSVANREKLGITGQGKMTTVAEIKDPELIKYEMPKSLQRWQSQSVDPKGAPTRFAAAQLAKLGVKSAFDVLNFYIDNHVLNFDPNFDPNKRHNLTHLITDGTKNILQKGMDNLKPEIDAEIEKYKARIPKIGEKQARSLMNDEILGAGTKRGLINSYFRSDSTSNNPLQKIQKVDIFNSLGNNLGFNIDHYMKTGNYQFDSTYNFTSTLDMGVRIPLIGGAVSALSSKYVSGQLYGETMMAVQNPMQYRVDIASGKQLTFKEPSKTEPVSKQPSKVVQGINKLSKSKSDVFDRDDVSFKKKKKEKVNESNTFSKLKKIRNKY